MLDKKTKKIIVREGGIFAFYCVLAIMVSRYSSISRTIVGDKVYTEFFPDLFILHLLAWLIIYAVIRSVILVVRAIRQEGRGAK